MQNLCNIIAFIQEFRFPQWEAKYEILEHIDSCEVFLVEADGKLQGCGLVQEIAPKKFHCELLVAKSKKAFRDLTIKFKKKYPDAEIVSATRRKKAVTYKGSITKKVINIYGRIC